MRKTVRIAILGIVAAAVAAVIVLKPRPADSISSAEPAERALPRLVDVGSNQCIPCKKMAPILEDLQEEYADRFIVEVIDVREDRAAAQIYGIRVIPTQIFYDVEGTERFRHEGFMPREAILAKWAELGIEP